jgi:protein ImuA
MPQSAAPAAARNRAAVMEELRRLLPRGAEGSRKALPFGVDAIDSHLPDGGLTCGALHEVVPDIASAMPAAMGFVAALLARVSSPSTQARSSHLLTLPWRGRVGPPKVVRGGMINRAASSPPPGSLCEPTSPLQGEVGHALPPLFVILPNYGLRQHGRLSGHGLNALGLDPGRLILVETAHRKQTLWAMEEALRSAAPLAVAGVIDTLDLKLSQRLHLAAADAGLPLFLLRPAQTLEASAAATRWRVSTIRAARDRFGLIARPRWHLHLERCRNGRPGEWPVEYDHVTHRFSLAAALADPAFSRGAEENAFRAARRA